MKRTLFLLLIIPFFTCQKTASKVDIIISDVSIIDVENSKILSDRTILIKGGRIVNIIEEVHSGVVSDTVLNGAGKFVIPGFWDMHAHVTWKENIDQKVFPIMLQYGVTGVRDMGGNAGILNSFKEKAKDSTKIYPSLYGPGPILDGEFPIHPAFSEPVTLSNLRTTLDSLYQSNVDFFKTYSLLTQDVMDTIAAYSKEKQIDFAGHISEYISPEKASELGQKSFEHLNKLEELIGDSDRISKFSQLVTQNENWLCPTLLIYQRKFEIENGEFFYHSMYEQLDPDLKFEWEQAKTNSINSPKTKLSISEQEFEDQKKLVKTFHDNGIPFLLGTDFAGMQFVYPGYSLHEEMALLQSIGISPFEILKMATYNPAVFLEISDSYGTIEINKMADLVILNSNPIENIENTLSISDVIKAGKFVRQQNTVLNQEFIFEE